MTGIGALIGLAVGIFLIIRKFNPAYSMMLAAILGGLIGGLDLIETVDQIIEGVRDMVPAIVRILSAGVLSGALVKTGSAQKIADSIIRGLGTRNVILALVLAVFLLTVSGVFVDVAVITAAPIGLAVGARAGLSRGCVLLALVGGGKAGNVVSPNPNTISVAEQFGADLSDVMLANWIPAVVGVIVTVFLAWLISRRGLILTEEMTGLPTDGPEKGPRLWAALCGPVVTLALLALRPLAGIKIDPFLALPAGGLACIVVTLNWSRLRESLDYGLSKMSGVAILLVGTGALAGILKNSTLKDMVLDFLKWTHLPEVTLAPVSGILMSAATGSTTAAATVAGNSFSATIMAAGVSAVAGAAMINAGATVMDQLPHGSFFHATAGSVQMPIRERLKLVPLETAIGFVLALVSLLVNM